MRRTVGILLLALAAAPRLAAQGDVASLIVAARAQLDQFNTDSASALLDRALAPRSGATSTQRVRAYVLLGIAQLSAKNLSAARQAFRNALQINPAERVDSLEFLEPENLLREFNAARPAVAEVAAPSRLAVDVDVPLDTTVSLGEGRLRVTARPTHRARVELSIAPSEAASSPVWSNVEIVDQAGMAAWNLRTREGKVVSSGQYVLRVTATDSLNRAATPVTRLLFIENPNAGISESGPVRVRVEGVLAFTVEPAKVVAGARWRVEVIAHDPHGNVATAFRDSVTVAIASATGRTGAHLSGTTRVAAFGGTATFPDLGIDSAGSDYKLTVTARDFSGASSASFDVVPAPASRLLFTTDPPTRTAGTTFGVLVTACDSLGNTATGFHDTVTVAIARGTGKTGAGLAGVTRVAAVAGVATFANLRIDSVGNGFALTISATGLPPATSAAFNTLSAPWGWASLTVGAAHVCGLASGGATYCWGANDHGELGDGSNTPHRTPTAVVGGLAFVSLTAGYDHTCGLTSAGVAYCWGEGAAGELGNGSTQSHNAPVPVAGGLTFAALTAGGRHTCGLTNSGGAYCWGQDSTGELGDGSTTNYSRPVAVAGGLAFVSLTAGFRHTCGLTTDGTAYCWGWNYFGQLGDSSTRTSDTPVRVQGGLRFAALAASGSNHTCGRSRGGAAYCWGDNSFGQVGDGSSQDRTTPVTVGGPPLTSLTTGDWHTCGLTEGGIAHCWGDNGYGELGDASTSSSASPVTVTGGLKLASLVAGYHHTCGVTTAGIAYCWGENLHGELADGSTKNRNTPVAVAKP